MEHSEVSIKVRPTTQLRWISELGVPDGQMVPAPNLMGKHMMVADCTEDPLEQIVPAASWLQTLEPLKFQKVSRGRETDSQVTSSNHLIFQNLSDTLCRGRATLAVV